METSTFLRNSSTLPDNLPAICSRIPASDFPAFTRFRMRVSVKSSNSSFRVSALGSSNGKKKSVLNSNYVVPLDNPANSFVIRPLVEILRDLNKRVPDKIIKGDSIPWYHANRMLSFYAPGWCGEIRSVLYSENGTVTVVYRVTIHGSDGEAHREASGTVSLKDGLVEDPVVAAEGIAFCRACSRFGLGLYLYHEDETQ